jgi:hypothetical protein
MKMLYIAGDRHDAQLAAFALRRVAPDVAVAWTSSLVAARRWVEENRTAAALIVEVDTDHSGLESFVDQVRGLGMAAPVIVAARNADAPVRSIERVNVQIVQKNDAYLNDLPGVVSRALGLQAPAAAPDASTPEPAGETSSEAQAAGAEGDPAATQRLFGKAVQARDVLEQRLREALTAIEHATQSRAADAAIITTLEQRLSETETARHELEQRAARLGALEQRLTETEAARRDLEQRIAAIGSFEQPLTEAETARQELEQRAATIATLEQRLTDADAARQELEQRLAASAALPAQFVAAGPDPALAQSLADAKSALEQAERRHAADMREATARLVEQRKHADERAAQATAALDALQARLVEEAAALQDAEHRAAADRQAAAEEAARKLAKIETDLAREVANRQTLETAVAAADAARVRADQRHAAELTAAADRLSEVEQQAERRLSEAATAAASLEARVAELAASLQRAEAQHALEMRESATRLGDHRAQAEARLAQANSAIAVLQSQLTDAAAALQRIEQEAAADRRRSAEQATERQTVFETQLSQERSERDALATRLQDMDAAYQHAVARHSAEIAASAAELAGARTHAEERLAEAAAAADAERQRAAERQTTFEAEIAQLVIGRQALEKELVERDTARQLAEQQHAAEVADAAARLTDDRQQAEARLAQVRSEAEALLAQVRAEADAALHEARTQAAADRDTAARERSEREAAFQADLAQEIARREVLEQEVAEARAAVDQAQRRFLEGVTAMRERAREHELRLEESAARERTQWEATLAEREERIGLLQSDRDVTRQTLAAREDHLQQVETLQRKERAEAAALATRLAELQDQTIRKQTADDAAALAAARRFVETPVAMWRSRPDGTMTQATQHLARLLGYASVDDLRKVDFAATVFDSSEELQWLIGRCIASGTPESVDTTWAKRDGTRMVVRLSALAATTDEIDLIAEDITAVRALEEKLDHAQRLEAVARYAAEVAVTCETVLKDASQQGQQWLAKLDGDIARRQGEALLAEITRAAGFLRQLAAYGDKQKNAPALVDVTDVLKNLGPVLKRVAGENIELVLPKGSAPLNLDVEAERVERILVNVAAYARGRMPFGGRLVIDVTSVVLDRAFAEKYPSVRPGAHVLFTVTEVKSATRADWSAAYLNPAQSGEAAAAAENPGVDLGVLQTLVSDSGGHLWMAAEPSGDMVLKIHLPRRALDDRGTPKRSGRWFSRVVAARG